MKLGEGLLELTAVGHLFSVYIRTFSTTFFIKKFPKRIIFFPLVLIYVNLFHPYIGFILSSIAFSWDAYHSSMQTFGFGQVLDARKKIYSEDTRLFDWFLNVIVYMGLLGLSKNWYDYLSTFETVLLTNKIIFKPFIANIQGFFQTFCYVSVCLSLIMYVAYYLYLALKHNIFSMHKHLLYFSTFIACYIAFIQTNNFFVSLLIVNAYHALQYWALVAYTENKEIEKEKPKIKPASFVMNSTSIFLIIGITIFILILKLEFIQFSNQFSSHPIASLYMAFYTSTAFIHFYFDSFIWSVKERSV
jgi:hypothetical protein